MTTIHCACLNCDLNNQDGICQAESIILTHHSALTVYDGRQEFDKCMMYKEADGTKKED